MNAISNFIFNPYCKTKQDVFNTLKNYPVETGHPFGDTILFFDKNNNKKETKREKKETYLSSVVFSNLEDKLEEYLNTYSQLEEIKNYTISKLNYGQNLSIPIPKSKKIFVFCCTKKTAISYFDLVIYHTIDPRTIYCVSFTQQKSPLNIVHSGDIGSLLHTLSIQQDVLDNEPFLLGAVGYNKTPLIKLKEQFPVFFIVNHETKMIYMVPIPLDSVSIGNSSMAGLALCKRQRDSINIRIMTKPYTIKSINTGEINSEIKSTLLDCLNKMHSCIEETTQIEAIDPISPIAPNATIGESCLIEYVERGLAKRTLFAGKKNLFASENTCVEFGTGLGVCDVNKLKSSKTDIVTLPIIGGECRNINALALGETLKSESLKPLNDKHIPIVHVSENMLDTVVEACGYIVNGLFILYPKKKISNPEEMNDLCINCLVMAGPNSIVLVYCGYNRYRWFRGVLWPGVIEQRLSFGDFISMDSIINSIRAKDFSLHWKTVIPKNFNKVYLEGEYIEIDQFVKMTENILEMQDKNKNATLDCFTQISILLNHDKLKEIVNKIDRNLEDVIYNETKEYKHKLLDYIKTHGSSDSTAKKLVSELKGQKTKVKKKIAEISKALGDLISIKYSGSKNNDLKRRQKQRKVQLNVKNSDQMTESDIAELLEETCEEQGVAIIDIDSGLLEKCIQEASDGNFLKCITSCNDLYGVGKISSRQPYLDAVTICALMEINNKTHDLYYDKVPLTIQQSYNSSNSSIPIAIFDKYVNMKRVSDFFWSDECNEKSISLWRIKLQDILTKPDLFRKYSLGYENPQLRFILVHLILCAMENLSSNMTSINDIETRNNRWNDTMCSIMRGLFGHLITLFASGAGKPLSALFQFFSNGDNIQMVTREESHLLYRIAIVFPFTCWDPEILVTNIEKYIIKFIRREVTDPVTEPIRKKMHMIKMNQNIACMEYANQKLSILEILVNVILFDFEHEEKSKLNARLAKRILKMVKQKDNYEKILDSSKSVRNIVSFCKLVSKKDFILDLDKFNILKDCILKIFIKRSAYFKEPKRVCIDDSKKENENLTKKEKHAVYNIKLKPDHIEECKKKLEDKVNKNSKGKTFTTEKYIQNYNRWKNCENTPLMYLYGDSELCKTPWSVNNRSEHNENVKIIEEIRNDCSTRDHLDQNNCNRVTKESKGELFEGLPCSENAQRMYNNINNVKWGDIVSSKHFIIHSRLIEFVNHNEENDDKFVQKVISTLLKNWNKGAFLEHFNL